MKAGFVDFLVDREALDVLEAYRPQLLGDDREGVGIPLDGAGGGCEAKHRTGVWWDVERWKKWKGEEVDVNKFPSRQVRRW